MKSQGEGSDPNSRTPVPEPLLETGPFPDAWKAALNRVRAAMQNPIYMPLALKVAVDLIGKGIPADQIPFVSFDECFNHEVVSFVAKGVGRGWEPFFHLSNPVGAAVWQLKLKGHPARFDDLSVEADRDHPRPKTREALVTRADSASLDEPLRPALANPEGRQVVRTLLLAMLQSETATPPKGTSSSSGFAGDDLAYEAQLATAEGAFDPKNAEDARKRILRTIVVRQGQPAFRADLLRAYGGRCAISECDADPALEAAHIVPYRGAQTNHVQNGLLLRADLHSLFDRGLLAINTTTTPWSLIVAESLQGTAYWEWNGKQVTLPADLQDRPSVEALDEHRLAAKL